MEGIISLDRPPIYLKGISADQIDLHTTLGELFSLRYALNKVANVVLQKQANEYLITYMCAERKIWCSRSLCRRGQQMFATDVCLYCQCNLFNQCCWTTTLQYSCVN